MKMKIRKNASTITGLTMSILIVIAIFFGLYFMLDQTYTDIGGVVDPRYQSAFENLSEAQDDLSNSVTRVQDSFNNITQAKNIATVAWNGLIGIGAALKIPIDMIDVSSKALQATVPVLDLFPTWVLTLMQIALIAFVVYLVLANLKGEPRL